MRLPTEWFRNITFVEGFSLQTEAELMQLEQLLWLRECRQCQEGVEERFVEACCGDLKGFFVIWPCRKELLKRELPARCR